MSQTSVRMSGGGWEFWRIVLGALVTLSCNKFENAGLLG